MQWNQYYYYDKVNVQENFETMYQLTVLYSKSNQLALCSLKSHPLIDINSWWQTPFFNIWLPE